MSIIYICSECHLANEIQNAQSSTVDVTTYERLKEYTYVEIKIYHPPRIHDTKYSKINKTNSIHDTSIHHKDITSLNKTNLSVWLLPTVNSIIRPSWVLAIPHA